MQQQELESKVIIRKRYTPGVRFNIKKRIEELYSQNKTHAEIHSVLLADNFRTPDGTRPIEPGYVSQILSEIKDSQKKNKEKTQIMKKSGEIDVPLFKAILYSNDIENDVKISALKALLS